MEIPGITIIGLGRFGAALTKKLAKQNISIKSIFNRSEEKAKKLAQRLKIETFGTFPAEKNQLGKLVFLTVPDNSIEETAHQLAITSGDFSGFSFVHCSGTEPAELLSPLKKKGAAIASFHPLQSFTGQSSLHDFENIFFSLQGDKRAFRILMPLAKKLGAHAFEADKKQKKHLHAAAVMASNYLVSLMKASTEIASLGGLSQKQSQKALLPLIQKTLQNIGEQPLGEALTGPIARGDIKTVEKHLILLKNQPHLQKIYTALGNEAVDLALESSTITKKEAGKLLKILENRDL